MRYLIYFILGISVSCTSKNDGENWGYFSDVQFSFDTLIFDSRDEIIFLKYDLLNSDLSIDGEYFFNFNMDDHTLEKINLNELRLESKIALEKEGPNGIGKDFGEFKISNENQLLITDLRGISLFSLDGQKLMSIRYDSFFLENDLMMGDDYLIPGTYLDKKAKKFYGLINRRDAHLATLGIFHLDNYDVFRVSLPDFHDLSKYAFTMSMGNSSIGFGPNVTLDSFGDKVVISNPVTSSIAIYDTIKDSLYVKNFNSQLTANQKINTYQLEHETEEALEEVYSRYHQEINYLPPFWDDLNQVFYRFSYQELPSHPENTGPVRSKIFLYVLDPDFKLIGEKEVIGLNKLPSSPFLTPFPKHFAQRRPNLDLRKHQ